MVAVFTGCKKEYDPPVVTAPASSNVEIRKSVDLTFQFIAEAGFSTASVTSTGELQQSNQMELPGQHPEASL
jgi:hypothetical protein